MFLAAAITSNPTGIDPVVKITLGNQEMSSSADDTVLTTMSMLTPEDDDYATRDCEDINNPQLIITDGMSYDRLDFNRPIRQLKHNYTSSSTLKSVKSTVEKSNREGGDGSSDDAQSPKDGDENSNNSFNNPTQHPITHNDDGYIDCADLVRRHVDNSNSPSSFIISAPQSNSNYSYVPSSQGIIPKVK